MAREKDPRLERAGVSGYNQPKRTPSHPTKSHVVVAKEGDEVKTIRFGKPDASHLRHVTQRTLQKVRCQQPTGLTRRNGSGRSI